MLAKALPPKQEYVLKVRLSGIQDKLYIRYLKNKGINRYMASDLFSTFAALAKVRVSWLVCKCCRDSCRGGDIPPNMESLPPSKLPLKDNCVGWAPTG